jgi:hypothetical protein
VSDFLTLMGDISLRADIGSEAFPCVLQIRNAQMH